MTDPAIHSNRDAAWQQTSRRAFTQADRNETTPGAAGSREDEASRLATHGDPTLTDAEAAAEEAARRAGVQWVRPTELAARAGSAVVERGAKWNTALHDATLEGIREGRARLHERLARRQDDLEPSTTTQGRAAQPVAGRTGVSR